MAKICFVWKEQNFNHMELNHAISITETLILVQLVNVLTT